MYTRYFIMNVNENNNNALMSAYVNKYSYI